MTHLRPLLVPIVATLLLESGAAARAQSQDAPLPSDLNATYTSQYTGCLADLGYGGPAERYDESACNLSGCCPRPGCRSMGCGCESRWCRCGKLADPWKICPENGCGIDFGGWVQSGFYNYDTGMFNNYPDRLNVHQVWLYAEKALDTECGWDWGFRLDYLYGTDAPDTQAFGNRLDTWDFGWFHGGYYGHAIPQLYAEVGYGDLSVKLGHFFTIIGHEVVAAPQNFFYSHCFGLYYAEPFTHSGALATYKASERLTFHGGWTAGFDTGFDRFEGDIFLGGVTLELGENVWATYTCTAGRFGFGTDASGYSHNVILDVKLTCRLKYVLHSDYIRYDGVVSNPASLVGPLGAPVLVNRYGVVNYLFYEINDCLQLGLRFEWFNAEEPFGPDRSDLYELTFGLNYRPHANLVIRPELRWDKDDDGFTVNPAREDRVGFGMDVIVTF